MGIRKTTQYTNSILKFKVNSKVQQNLAVAELTHNKPPVLSDAADDIRRVKSEVCNLETLGVKRGGYDGGVGMVQNIGTL